MSGNKIDGIPIWPPINKLSPLDAVVVHKDLSVTSLGDPLTAMKLISVQGTEELKKLIKNLTSEMRNPYEISDVPMMDLAR